MMNKSKVSVIIPIYGVEKYLRQCLDSVLAQTLQEIEIILVNDGSPDECPKIIDEYAAKDGRITAIHKPNGGYGSACNVGFARAAGEYAAIVEPDDFINRNMYEQLYETAHKNNCDVVKSAFYRHYDIAGKEPYDVSPRWFPKRESRWTMPHGVFTIYEHPEFFYFHPSVWSCIYRRDFIEQHQIRMEELPGAGWADNLFQVQTLCVAKSIAYIDTAFYHWRLLHDDDAKDLKDLTIPFLRTRTIHAWLQENNITDDNLWACLHKREFAYMRIMLRAASRGQLPELKSTFKKMLRDMSRDIIKNNKYITCKERHLYRQLPPACSCRFFWYTACGWPRAAWKYLVTITSQTIFRRSFFQLW